MSKSLLRLRLTRGRRLGQFAMLPSLRPRVKRLVQNDLDVLSHPKVALSDSALNIYSRPLYGKK